MADTAYDNPCTPVSAISFMQDVPLNHFHRYHRIGSLIVMLAAYCTTNSVIDMLQKKVFVFVIVFVGNSVFFGKDNIARKRNQ